MLYSFFQIMGFLSTSRCCLCVSLRTGTMIIAGLNIANGIIIATFAAWVATNPDWCADAINDSLMMRTKDVSKGEQNSDKAVIAKQLREAPF